MLGQRRFEQELRRRKAALRAAAHAKEEQERRQLLAQEQEAAPLLAQNASRTRGAWDCAFCGRSFHGYGTYLNHRCDGS